MHVERKRWIAILALIAAAGFAGGAVAASMTQDASMQRLTEARRALVEAKSGLDMYGCCIGPACNFCALAAAMCPCGENIESDEGVCGECWLGWRAGQGAVYGVEAADVQPLSGELLQRMYEWRAEATPGEQE